jgi:SP family general alpha glucoside:H+ symporter-like MFS transporter
MLNGIVAERIGYRWSMIGALLWMIGIIFLFVFAQSLEMLLAGQILCGVAWG